MPGLVNYIRVYRRCRRRIIIFAVHGAGVQCARTATELDRPHTTKAPATDLTRMALYKTIWRCQSPFILSLSHPLFATPKWQYFSSVQFCCPHSVWLWNWKHSVGAAFFPFLFSNWKEGWIFHSIVQFQILCNFRCCSMLLRSIQFTHSHFKLEFEIFPPASLSFIIDLLAFAGLKLIKFFFSLAFRFVFTFCNWNIRIELGDLVEWAWN